MGTVISRKVGRIRPKSFPICRRETPRDTTNSTNLNMRAVSRIKVKARSPSRKGGTISEIR
jgi:hypothetical protein